MENLLNELSFDDWIRYAFDHPVTDPQWYWEDNRDVWDTAADPNITIAYLTSLFANPTASLAPYTDAQISQGLWFLVSKSSSDHIFVLKDNRVPLEARLDCIRSIYRLFEELFLPRCTGYLQHINEQNKATPNPLDFVCYMWWDLLPIRGSTLGADPQPTAETILDVLTHTLALDSDACRESALHGLGHWRNYAPAQIELIIDTFIKNPEHAKPELIIYAGQARKGRIL